MLADLAQFDSINSRECLSRTYVYPWYATMNTTNRPFIHADALCYNDVLFNVALLLHKRLYVHLTSTIHKDSLTDTTIHKDSLTDTTIHKDSLTDTTIHKDSLTDNTCLGLHLHFSSLST